MAGVNERWPGGIRVVVMKRECRDRAESKEQMDSVHSCHPGPSAWQAGCGLARGEDRGEPLNVYPLHFEVIYCSYTHIVIRIISRRDASKLDNLSYSYLQFRGQY